MSETPKSVNKRTRSSEGETPSPDSKTTKMASNPQIVSEELKAQVSAIAESVKDIKEGQETYVREKDR